MTDYYLERHLARFRDILTGLIGEYSASQIVTARHNRIIFKLPDANQRMASQILNIILKFTNKHRDYVHICGDEKILNPGEIGIELIPGCDWCEINTLEDFIF